MRCLRAVAGYIIADHKKNEDTGDNSDRICRKEWIEHL
jgi:hypothetical protein